MLVGTMNPEEGELRPQLTDRFGLCVDVTSIHDLRQRVDIVERRERYEADPLAFLAEYAPAEQALKTQIIQAASIKSYITVPRPMAELIAHINIELNLDGHRGDIVVKEVVPEHIYTIAPMALAHRLKRLPMQQVSRTLDEALAAIKRKY